MPASGCSAASRTVTVRAGELITASRPSSDTVVEAIERTGSVCGSIYDGRLIQRAAGIASMAGARYSESESHFAKALQQAEVLNQAMDDYERMGMTRHRDLTSTLLGR
jgi:hypothetical protein